MTARIFIHAACSALTLVACEGTSAAPPPPPANWTGPGLEVLSYSTDEIGQLALGSGTLSWVYPSGSVAQLEETEPDPQPLASGLDHPWSVATDGTTVFWSDARGISSCTAPACADRQLLAKAAAETSATWGTIEGILLDEKSFYWVESGEIRSCSRAGCAASGPSVLATGQLIDDWLTHPLAADDANLYWVANGGVVTTVPKAGGMPSVIATGGLPIVEGIAVDATAVYWVAFNQHQNGLFSAQINSVPLGGGAITVLDLIPGVAYDLAVDETSVYYSANVSEGNGGSGAVGGVFAIDKSLGALSRKETVATNQENPAAVAVDDGYVYWITGGAVVRTAK